MDINAHNHPAQFCMICLDGHRKLYSKRICNLDLIYENLTGISLGGAMNFSPMFCSECAQRLISCGKFRDKSLRAHRLLSDLHKNNAVLSLQTLSSVDRARWQLTSSVVHKTFEPNHCDLYVIEDIGSINKTLVKSEKKDLHLEYQEVKCDYDYDFDDDTYENEVINKNDIIVDIKDDDVQENDKTNDVRDNNMQENYKTIDVKDDDVQWLDLDFDIDEENDSKDNIELKFLKNCTKEDHSYVKNVNSLSNRIRSKKRESDRVNSNNVSLKNSTEVDKQYGVINNESDSKTNRLYKPKGKVKLKNAVKDRTARVKSKNIRVVKRNSIGNLINRRHKLKIQPERGDNLEVLAEHEYFKGFEISERSADEQLADWSLRQQSGSYSQAQYKCTTCYKGFWDADAYKTHMDRHTDKHGLISCPVCQIRVNCHGRLTKHVNNNHRYRLTCSACSYVTNNKHSATQHTRWHNGHKYKCSYCDCEFSKYTSRLTHMRIEHPSEHACALCGYCFVSATGLAYHTSKKHYGHDEQELSGPRCEQCDIRFAHEAAYEIHMKVSPKHAAPGNTQSNDPSRIQNNKNAINMKTGRPGRRTNCEVCGIELESARSYRFHLMESHPQHKPTKRLEHMCHQCGKVFAAKCTLEEHMLMHSGESPLECGECGKRFRYSATLKMHLERHSGAAPRHRCALCPYQTTEKGNLTRHLEIHLDPDARKHLLKYCNECGKTFTTTAAKRNHILHVHQNVPWPKRVRPSRPRKKVSRTQSEDDPSEY